jgi:hypothetical protein
MSDFTPEQKAEIQKMMSDAAEAARIDQSAKEQFRVTADRRFRKMLIITAEDVQRGEEPQYAMDVAKALYSDFLARFFPQGAPAPEQKDEGAEDEKPEE